LPVGVLVGHSITEPARLAVKSLGDLLQFIDLGALTVRATIGTASDL
jgi:hypothetical protein